MNNDLRMPKHNEIKETKIQVTQIIELGNVTELTLGGRGSHLEGSRPMRQQWTA